MPLPDIYDYDDHRRYLRDWFDVRRAEQPGYSYSVFARTAGIAHKGSISRALRGGKRLTDAMGAQLVTGLGLEGEEARYFRLLAELHNLNLEIERARGELSKATEGLRALEADNAERTDGKRRSTRRLTNRVRSREQALERLRVERRRCQQRKRAAQLLHDAQLIERQQFSVLSSWYHAAISELSRCQGFRRDPAWIREALDEAVTEEEAADALEALSALEMLHDGRREEGQEPPVMRSTGPEIRFLAVQSYYDSISERALASMRRLLDPEETPYNRRCRVGALTVAIPDEAIGEVKALLQDFQERLHGMLEAHEGAPRTQVYQAYFHLFPLTRAMED